MFTAAQFVAIAKTRYGEVVLRTRMRGSVTDTTAADTELKRIANGVIGRVQDAVGATIGWPIPGTWPTGSKDDDSTDIGGTAYADVWPKNLLQMAMDLFNWRTVSGLDQSSDNIRRAGMAAEAYFEKVESGELGIGISTGTGPTSPGEPMSARARDGSSNISGGGDDRDHLLDFWGGRSWDGPW